MNEYFYEYSDFESIESSMTTPPLYKTPNDMCKSDLGLKHIYTYLKNPRRFKVKGKGHNLKCEIALHLNKVHLGSLQLWNTTSAKAALLPAPSSFNPPTSCFALQPTGQVLKLHYSLLIGIMVQLVLTPNRALPFNHHP